MCKASVLPASAYPKPQPVQGVQLSDFDPLERERLRQNIQHYGGDRILLELDDEAFAAG